MSNPSQIQVIYIGTYCGERSKGIYVSEIDMLTGELTPPKLAAETRNPTFLATDSKCSFLYAANEIENYGGKKDSGSVSAFP
jgi:6-phosphogluconolactonase (cycloisomerase 2 family)